MNAKATEKKDRCREAFWEWAKENPHTMQISFPRSGRHWFQSILRDVTGCKIEGIGRVQPEDHGDILCYTDHGGTWKVAPENGKYILLVRDPRDAILSYCMLHVWDQGGHKEITEEEGLALLDRVKYMQGWTRNWRDLLTIYQPLQTLIVYYERTLLYPQAEVSRVCKFLGVPLVRDPLEVMQARDVYKDDITKSKGYRQETFATGVQRYQAHCLKWRRCPAFLERHVPEIWSRIGDAMVHHGYVEEGHSTNLLAPH